MNNKKQTTGFSFSQDADLTKIAIVLPTQTAKNIFYWILLPTISSSFVWFSGVLPVSDGHRQPQQPPAIEKTHPIP